MKQLTVALTTACASAGAMAQQADDNVMTVGWSHIMSQDSGNDLTTSVINAPINDPLRLPGSFTSPNSGLRVSNTNTLGLTLTYFFIDSIALITTAGVLPEFKLTGCGVTCAPGPAGAPDHVDPDDPSNRPAVCKVRQWSPGVILQWYFEHAQSMFRPSVGVGMVYSFFTNIKLNPYFAAAMNCELGSVLAAGAGRPGSTYAKGKSSPLWAPIFNLGASYVINKQWALTATVLYLPSKTEVATIIKALDGIMLVTIKTTLKANPIITSVGVSYKFQPGVGCLRLANRSGVNRAGTSLCCIPKTVSTVSSSEVINEHT